MANKRTKDEKIGFTIAWAFSSFLLFLFWYMGVFHEPKKHTPGTYDFKETVWHSLHPITGFWNITGFVMLNLVFLFFSGLWLNFITGKIYLPVRGSGVTWTIFAFAVLGVVLLFS
jgi:hypothetical protein